MKKQINGRKGKKKRENIIAKTYHERSPEHESEIQGSSQLVAHKNMISPKKSVTDSKLYEL